MKNYFPILAVVCLFAAVCFTSSCATIFLGTTAKITVDSKDVHSASITADGEVYRDVKLPARIKVKRGKEASTIVAESNNLIGTAIVEKKLEAGNILLGVLGGIPGIIVDACTGAFFYPEKNYYVITLYPDAFVPNASATTESAPPSSSGATNNSPATAPDGTPLPR